MLCYVGVMGNGLGLGIGLDFGIGVGFVRRLEWLDGLLICKQLLKMVLICLRLHTFCGSLS